MVEHTRTRFPSFRRLASRHDRQSDILEGFSFLAAAAIGLGFI
jgi:hypothetical protein